MIELPEAYVLAKQISETLTGKTIIGAEANHSPHGFAFYSGDPAEYGRKLSGRKITGSLGMGYTYDGNIGIMCDGALIVVTTPVKYHASGTKLPAKHQLMLEFDDGSHLTCTVQMWGSMNCYILGEDEVPERDTSKPSPLTDAFDAAYFEAMRGGVKPTLSAKALLATEQRIPGLGNGVLQDILFNARINPRRKLNTISDAEFAVLFESVKSTLSAMTELGGRDTVKDLFGQPGGYKTTLSAKAMGMPCPVCGDLIVREAFLGGNVYYCPTCQVVDRN